MFTELSRRMGLPLFASARRSTALAGRVLDDEVIAESMLGQARRPWAEVREAPFGIVDDGLAPGWLIPGRLPQPLDLAPPPLTALLARTSFTSTASDGHSIMINRRTAAGYNSLAIKPEPVTLEMHPTDSAARGLVDGDPATISTESGSCTATVRVTERIRIGVVSLPHGVGSSDVNQLTSSAGADSLSAMPVLSGFPVAVAASSPSG